LIHLAYDGSINGDWVAWYAQNLARQEADRTLRVIYINTDEISAEEVHAKVATMESASSECGVTLKLDIIPSSGPGTDTIFQDILNAMPTTPGTLMVCGVRLNAGTHGYLAGTVSERLLSDRSFDVMAVRVVQPGLLGAPHRFLVPVAGDREGFLTSAEILRHFSPSVSRVHLLRVMMIKRLLFRRLQHSQAENLRQKGWESMAEQDRQLAELTGIDQVLIDANVVVSDDWAHEVIIAANRHKSHLILMEAAWKNLRRTFHYGNPVEIVLRDAPCDVAIYRGV
jgi:nucleotide-binding universal stress UspA family protein